MIFFGKLRNLIFKICIIQGASTDHVKVVILQGQIYIKLAKYRREIE